jgi:dolichol-phosphate mannosyltransferase
MNVPNPAAPPLKLLSVVIPARDEADALPATVQHLHLELEINHIPHEIVVVDDGSQDATWAVLQDLAKKFPRSTPCKILASTASAVPSRSACGAAPATRSSS